VPRLRPRHRPTGVPRVSVSVSRGTAYAGAIITRFTTRWLVKVTAWSPTPEETLPAWHRGSVGVRIRGVVTNLRFLDSAHHASAFRHRGLHH